MTNRGDLFRFVPITIYSGWLSDMDRERIERQLKLAEEQQADCEKVLTNDKVDAKEWRRNAKWRHLDADTRALKRRVIAVKGIEDREAEALQRKADKVAAAAAAE